MSDLLVVFDGDDTPWWAEPLYDEARLRAADVVARAGLDPLAWEQLERRLDVENVQRFGLSAERFPTSCADAYRKLARQQGCPIDEAVAEEVRVTAATVFETQAPVVGGAETVLTELGHVATLALLTKGDEQVQHTRVADSGLGRHFALIEIVDHKDESSFAGVLDQLGVHPSRAWSVGNSLHSDILPAIAIGMCAAWIDAHVWEHERHHEPTVHDRIWECSRLAELPELILGTHRVAEAEANASRGG